MYEINNIGRTLYVNIYFVLSYSTGKPECDLLMDGTARRSADSTNLKIVGLLVLRGNRPIWKIC